MPWPWGRIVEAVRALLERKPDPSTDLPADARDELARWDREDVARYQREQAEGERDAPPDAPHVDEGEI